MPRALYRMARGSGRRGNQDPYVLRAAERKPSSFQVKDYVLCRDCEQRLSKNGEKYVMGIVTKRDGRFPLLEKLDGVATRMHAPKWRSYSVVDTPDVVDRAKVAYFALSVFWRASIHTWIADDGERVRIDLGSKYNEELRRYLLGEMGVPKNAALLVAACTDEVSQKSFFMPGPNAKIKDRSFGVMVRGLFLLFRITKTPSEWHARLSMINAPHEWILVWDCFAQGVWKIGQMPD
jgi:hypothetical protein